MFGLIVSGRIVSADCMKLRLFFPCFLSTILFNVSLVRKIFPMALLPEVFYVNFYIINPQIVLSFCHFLQYYLGPWNFLEASPLQGNTIVFYRSHLHCFSNLSFSVIVQ